MNKEEKQQTAKEEIKWKNRVSEIEKWVCSFPVIERKRRNKNEKEEKVYNEVLLRYKKKRERVQL